MKSLHFFSFFFLILLLSCEKSDFKWDLDRNNFNDTLCENYGANVPNENCPQIQTLSFSNLTQNSVSISGKITNIGSSEVTSYGVCWSINLFPTISNNHSNNGSAQDLLNFQSNLSGLIPSTKYYLRAYATNSFGTSYGNQIEIQTMDQVPVLISTNPCNTLSGINSSFDHWHSSSYDSHQWSTTTVGYNGGCIFAPNGSGGGPIGGYIEFPIVFTNNGYLSFWIRSGSSGTWYGANRIPVIYVDGVELSTPTIISGASEFDWQKIKTALISEGNHVLKIYWSNISNTSINYKIDEIETWEFQ